VVYVIAEEREAVLMRLGDDRHLGYGDPDVMTGTRVGPFTIVRMIGAAGMGKVYVAEHTSLKSQRAAKLLSPRPAEGALFVRRMMLDDLECDALADYLAIHTGPIRAQVTAPIVREFEPDKTATVERSW
jgi:hypothetical protein